MRRRTNAGFTLVELMIVVAIIGVLASLATYGVVRYIKHAKTAEATRSLGSIEVGSDTQYQQETPFSSDGMLFVHTFCPPALPTPATVPKGSKFKVPESAWLVSGWACLKFAMSDPQYYSYAYENNSATGTAAQYTATAWGDLDGNGVISTFEVTGRGGPTGDSFRESMRVILEDE